MATALASQLAQIRAKSSNPLDLKAQRKAHSKSLLFDHRDAANQDFDTIYQLCHEGYLELCQLDSRFTPYAKNLFSEQSKEEDRMQMTEAQNNQLNGITDDFLALVGSRLLLKPALKSVEWLVRRFRSVIPFTIQQLKDAERRIQGSRAYYSILCDDIPAIPHASHVYNGSDPIT